ncbi:MAG: Tol-Pal system beta propeller repeat protein TolB [Pseudomonadales bacterium]|nr:Tol-Pal system beta propeller repeat protein TolB [Pseudomonadales bacterium]
MYAGLAIEIVEGRDNPIKIAIVPFGQSLNLNIDQDISGIVAFDLARSGQFAPMAEENMLSYPDRQDKVYFRDWKILKVDYLVIGRVEQEYNADLSVVYHLFDVVNARHLISRRVTGSQKQIRDIAHSISDEVYQEVTDIPGAFSTKLVYVLAQDLGTKYSNFKLQLADTDGERVRTLLSSKEPILSASWSPDGSQVAYVSFEGGRPAVYLHNISTNSRRMLSTFPGINSAPVWSPDGRKLAMVLSKDGNAEIYVRDIGSSKIQRVTRHPAIDTEPAWTPDGSSLVFTSDRGGKPQIYRINLSKGITDRLTFQGDYNARARLLPDGKHLIYVHRSDGVYHIALQDLERDRIMVLTQTDLNESPSISPNGSMLIYATQDNGQGILAVVSIDGTVKYRLPSSLGDVREPAWSPYLKSVLRSENL